GNLLVAALPAIRGRKRRPFLVATLWGRAPIQDDTVRTDSQIPWSASGVERSCKVSNLQRHRRARSDPNCLRPACPAGGRDADLTVGPGRSPSFPQIPKLISPR